MATCPYCKKDLIKEPKKKAICNNCDNEIFVRTKQAIFEKHLVTKEQAFVIDWFKKISHYGFNENHYRDEEKRLNQNFKPNPKDIIWSLLNKLLLNSNSLDEQKMTYWEMARFLFEEGKDPNKMLKESNRCQLKKFQDSGLKIKVRIDCVGSQNNSCEKCQKQNNKIYTIEKALKEMPLPCESCTHDTSKNGFSWCRCMWVAEL